LLQVPCNGSHLNGSECARARSDSCDFVCLKNYFKNGSACTKCNMSICEAGYYRETCEFGSIADAACLPCSKPDWKANSRLTVSEVFNTDSCGHTCNAGFFKTAFALTYNVTNGSRVKTETRMELRCSACNFTSCEVGFFRNVSACSDLSNAICVPCTGPNTGFSYFTSAGSPYQTDQCDWECDSGYWMNETLQGCQQCEHLLCPTGQYRLSCGGRSPGVCTSCTNAPANSNYTESVLPIDAPLGLQGRTAAIHDGRVCPWRCNPGYWRNSSTCVACNQSSCPSGSYRSQCTTQTHQCACNALAAY
jgi:hypothetical protein